MVESGISRRDVMKGAGGALILTFSTTGVVAAQEGDEASLPGSLSDAPLIDSWISINADGTVTVTTGKAELGQGIKTAVIQIAADELNVAVDRMKVETADTGDSPNEGYTAGSGSMMQSGTAITYAAAEAKYILKGLATAFLDADRTELTVEDGTVRAPDGRTTTYWDLLGGRYFQRRASGTVEPESASTHDIVGTYVPRVDIPDKVTGNKAYVQDLERPGMVHGRVVRPPAYGATLVSLDASEVRNMPGVLKVVRNGDFLGVVAEREGQAIRAMEALQKKAEWTVPATMPNDENIYEYLLQKPSDDTVLEEYNEVELVSKETVDKTISKAAIHLDAEYRVPYRMHGSIGPSCAVAEFQGDNLVVWTHSQGVFPLRDALSNLLSRPKRAIRCIHKEGAGCYGHNGADDAAGDAALLSRAVDGKPVRVQWTREQEHRWEPYGSAMVLRPHGGVDSEGNIVGFREEVWSHTYSTRPSASTPLLAGLLVEEEASMGPPWPGGGYRDAARTYDIPDQSVTNHFLWNSPLRVSALRSLGSYGNVFALESFVDELAVEAGIDPLQFRLNHLSDERSRAVIEEVAKISNWRNKSFARGRGHGIAFNRYENVKAYTAVVAEVTVDRATGHVSVDTLYGADDSGEAVAPDGIANQIEGGLIQSTSWTLKEHVRYTPDRIISHDWKTYPILTFSEVPDVEVSVIDRPGEPYLGTGETAQGPTPAAIGNAVYDATGARLRETPFTPDRVKAALNESSSANSTSEAMHADC